MKQAMTIILLSEGINSYKIVINIPSEKVRRIRKKIIKFVENLNE